MKLFDKIRILRKARGLSQEQLGYSLSRVNKDGISRQTVSDWENGKFEPKLENIRDLAEVFNVSFDALLDEAVDLDNESVLEAVLNQLPYKNKNEEKIEEEVKEITPEIKRCNITFKEILLLALTSYGVISYFVGIIRIITTVIESADDFYTITSLVQLGIDSALLALFVVAFIFLIIAIRKRQVPKLSMILLLIVFSLVFLLVIWSSVGSIQNIVSHAEKRPASITVNGVPSTPEKYAAGTIFGIIFSVFYSSAFLAGVIYSMLAYKKEKVAAKLAETKAI